MSYVDAEKLWICQKPCGFQSSSGDPVEWISLYGLWTQYKHLVQLAQAYAIVYPTLLRDVRKFLTMSDNWY